MKAKGLGFGFCNFPTEPELPDRCPRNKENAEEDNLRDNGLHRGGGILAQ